MLKNAQKLIPPLLSKFHKGQCGRVLVVGGSEDYAGAPYFAAMASALTGADMSHVLCSKGAGPVIKSYSPNLMVHPYLVEAKPGTRLAQPAIDLLKRIHVVLIGPGLGRDSAMFEQVIELVNHIKELRIPLVIDADGLYLLQTHTDLLNGVSEAVLTPNVVEFSRLTKAFGLDSDHPPANAANDDDRQRDLAVALAKRTGAVVLMKGREDVVASASGWVANSAVGSPRRVSGQGDTLSGTLLTFVSWKKAWSEKLWDVEPIDGDPLVAAAFGASTVVRKASELAYAAKSRGMVTTDVNDRVGEAFNAVFES